MVRQVRGLLRSPEMIVRTWRAGKQFVAGLREADVRTALQRSGLPPGQLCLELTESVLLEDALFSTRALYRSLDGGDSWEPRGAAPHSKTFAVGPDRRATSVSIENLALEGAGTFARTPSGPAR